MTDRELMQQALDALEANLGNWAAKTKAIAALRERMSQPAPPPECQTEEEKTAFAFGWMKAMEAQRLAQPEQEPQRQWQGLTEQDIWEIAEKLGLADVAWVDLMQAIERRLKRRNT